MCLTFCPHKSEKLSWTLNRRVNGMLYSFDYKSKLMQIETKISFETNATGYREMLPCPGNESLPSWAPLLLQFEPRRPEQFRPHPKKAHDSKKSIRIMLFWINSAQWFFFVFCLFVKMVRVFLVVSDWVKTEKEITVLECWPRRLDPR